MKKIYLKFFNSISILQKIFNFFLLIVGPLFVLLATFLILLIIYVHFMAIIPFYFEDSYFTFNGLFHIFLSIWLSFNILFNYFMTIFTSPGTTKNMVNLYFFLLLIKNLEF